MYKFITAEKHDEIGAVPEDGQTKRDECPGEREEIVGGIVAVVVGVTVVVGAVVGSG